MGWTPGFTETNPNPRDRAGFAIQLALLWEARSAMAKTIYVGNLPFRKTEDEIKALFAQYGEVLSVRLISDRDTGRPRGFGFVEMNDEHAVSAIEALDGTDFGGRNLRVNEAQPRAGGPPR
jgi:RNA recognition motif-containing protein